MRMMASFFRAYPGRTTVMLLALLLSGVAERCCCQVSLKGWDCQHCCHY
jgi:hypothetical protein